MRVEDPEHGMLGTPGSHWPAAGLTSAARPARIYESVRGSVSKVEMTTPMALICKALFPSISTFETPPVREVGDGLSLAGASAADLVTSMQGKSEPVARKGQVA